MTVTVTAWNDTTSPSAPGFGSASGFRSPFLARIAVLAALALHALDDHWSAQAQQPCPPPQPDPGPQSTDTNGDGIADQGIDLPVLLDAFASVGTFDSASDEYRASERDIFGQNLVGAIRDYGESVRGYPVPVVPRPAPLDRAAVRSIFDAAIDGYGNPRGYVSDVALDGILAYLADHGFPLDGGTPTT